MAGRTVEDGSLATPNPSGVKVPGDPAGLAAVAVVGKTVLVFPSGNFQDASPRVLRHSGFLRQRCSPGGVQAITCSGCTGIRGGRLVTPARGNGDGEQHRKD